MSAQKLQRQPIPLMIIIASLAAMLLLAGCGTSPPIGTAVPVAAGQDFRATAGSASRLVVYEGLPHQAHEPELLQREAARRDVTQIAGYSFYTPGVPAREPVALRQALGNPGSFSVYRGPKTCGGFHPDYAITWDADGRSYAMLICFGCGEALFLEGERRLPYDLTRPALAELQRVLAPHAMKRPLVGR